MVDGRDLQLLQAGIDKFIGFAEKFEDLRIPSIVGNVTETKTYLIVFGEGETEEWVEPGSSVTYMVRAVQRAFFDKKSIVGAAYVGYARSSHGEDSGDAEHHLIVWSSRRDMLARYKITSMMRNPRP